MKIMIQWGGFYAYKGESGVFRVFRLLDLNADAYHAQLFKEEFDSMPSIDEVKVLVPYIWHVPMATTGLLNNNELTLIGYEPLDERSLQGYEEFMRQMERPEDAIKEMIDRLIDFSHAEPMSLMFENTEEGLVITPED